MIAHNMKELEQMLLREMVKAMNVTSDKVLANMYEETGKFYTSGNPVMYQRTGALGDTPKTTSLSVSGKSASFEAYLDQSGGYSTGKSPSMHDVLNLANYRITSSSVGYLKPALGKAGFWERAEKKMEKTLNQTMKKFFR